MKRPKPTKGKPPKRLIEALCGGNQTFVASMHHGLYEYPSLRLFYPHLDLDEFVAFPASSWQARARNPQAFYNFDLERDDDIYQLFSHVFFIGMAWLNKYKKIPHDLLKKDRKLNPFKRKRLQERLERIDREAILALKRELHELPNTYVFAYEYSKEKAKRGGDDSKLVLMHWMSAYPKKGRNVSEFAAEVARMIGHLPQDYVPLQIDLPLQSQLQLPFDGPVAPPEGSTKIFKTR